MYVFFFLVGILMDLTTSVDSLEKLILKLEVKLKHYLIILGSVRSLLRSSLFSCTGLTLGFRFPVVPQAQGGVGVEKSPWGQADVGSGRLALKRIDPSLPGPQRLLCQRRTGSSTGGHGAGRISSSGWWLPFSSGAVRSKTLKLFPLWQGKQIHCGE